MSVVIRPAELADLPWVNSKYDEVGFVHSSLVDETVAIAELNGAAAGLGRIQQVADGEAELGGMYVFPEFRRRGIAEQIIRFLLEEGANFNRIWCLPFSHLKDYYRQFGFVPVTDHPSAPPKVLEKHGWCNSNYDQPVLLLVRDRESHSTQPKPGKPSPREGA